MAFFDRIVKNSQIWGTIQQEAGNISASKKATQPSPKAVIFRSELDYMSRCILDYPNIETGGNLFGYWTQDGTPVVLYAIGPGRKAEHNNTSFAQDMGYLKSVATELYGRFRLQHIGEWHSHHQLGLDHPSGGDAQHMKQEVDNPRFPRMLLCIGTCTPQETSIKPFNFYVETGKNYVEATFDIVNTESPYRALADKEAASILLHPQTKEASHCHSMMQGCNERQPQKVHWLTETVENVELMKTFVEEVRQVSGYNDVKAIMNDTGEPGISFNSERFEIRLPWRFPQIGPALMESSDGTGDYEQILEKVRWNYPKLSLFEAFSRWLEVCTQLMPELSNTEC